MKSICEIQNFEIQELSYSELNEVNGGGWGYDIGYIVGQAVGDFSKWFWAPYTSTAGDGAVMAL